MAKFDKYTSDSTDYVSYGLILLGIDPSLNSLKFSQMKKLLSRYRFLNINFGELLDIIFKKSGEKYDPKSSLGDRHINSHGKGFKAKFTREKISLTIFEKDIVSILIYIIAWMLKFEAFIMLNIMNYTKKITRMQCYIIHFIQKIHFVAFNNIIMDLVFYSCRMMAQTRAMSNNENIFTVIVIFMAVFDVCEIWLLSSSSEIKQGEFDLFRKKELNQQELV